MNQSNLSIEAFHSELAQKIKQYTITGWWVPAATKQATPTYAVYTKEKWYIENRIQSATAE